MHPLYVVNQQAAVNAGTISLRKSDSPTGIATRLGKDQHRLTDADQHKQQQRCTVDIPEGSRECQ